MFSSCALCHQDAVFPVVVLEGESWFGDSDSGKLRLGLYGLYEACAALPYIIRPSTENFSWAGEMSLMPLPNQY